MAFEGKTVLVTGAASGLGAATAVHFAKHGASLALTDKNMSTGFVKTVADCKKVGNRSPFVYQADLTSEPETKKLIEAVLNNYTRLDVLVNCAGIFDVGTIETTSIAQFDKLLNTNVRSVYCLTMLAVPHLIATKGCIVNVSSVVSLRPRPGILAYCMSKGAVDLFTKCVALELAPKGVRVNSVNPGTLDTNIFKNAGLDDETVEGHRGVVVHPLSNRRLGTAEEVARTIVFLAGPDAGFTTGVNLPVDGGRSV